MRKTLYFVISAELYFCFTVFINTSWQCWQRKTAWLLSSGSVKAQRLCRAKEISKTVEGWTVGWLQFVNMSAKRECVHTNTWTLKLMCRVSVQVNMTDPWLRAGVGEQVHFAKVIGRGQQGSVMWPAHSINVCAVCSIRPNSLERKRELETEREKDSNIKNHFMFRFRLHQNAVRWFDQRSVWTLLCQQKRQVKM